MLSGSGNALTTYTGFTVTLFLGVAVTALFVLRWREPNAPRPFKALGYPIAPAIFAIACLLIVPNALYTDLVTPMTTGTAVWSIGRGAAGHRARLAALLVVREQEVARHSEVKGIDVGNVASPMELLDLSDSLRPTLISSTSSCDPAARARRASRVSKPAIRTSILCPPGASRRDWNTPSNSSPVPA